MDDMDYAALQSELLRSWRGGLSQRELSRKLGYRSDVVFDWESGRRQPSAAKAFACALLGGVDLVAALHRFNRQALEGLRASFLCTDAGVAALMRRLRGSAQLQELADELGCSRYTLGRWLKAQVSPSLEELLRYVQVTTLRVVDFCAELADPSSLPSIQREWERLCLARGLAYSDPWAHAVLRILELKSYRTLAQHEEGFIARRLGLSVNEEKRLLALLVQSGQAQICDNRYELPQSSAVDTRKDAQRSRELRAFWSEVAAQKLRAGAEGEYAFNLFGVSRADLEKIKALQRDYFAELRRIVGQSEPVEVVVLSNLHLVPLAE
jgi:transcriptional regulator with XRE-family HTH domain